MTLIIKTMLWQVGVWLLCWLVLFLSADTLIWPAGWIFFILFFGFVLFLSLYLLRTNVSLLNERLTLLRSGQPCWDRAWVLNFYLLSLIWLALMPLDAMRWQWSHMPVFLQTIGLLFFLCSLVGIFLTIRENRFLSPVIRLQAERGQTVISTGVYHYVRHPLYATASLFYLGVPLVLGSWAGVLCAPLFIGLMAWRSIQEERLLCHRLSGYTCYMQQVTWRFIPGIW